MKRAVFVYGALMALCLGWLPACAMLPLEVQSMSAWAQNHANQLYVRTYGESSRPALVFLHGGPGSNAASFEAILAPELAKSHFVVVYDQRGCGRSQPASSADDYDFNHALADLDAVITKTNIQRPLLIGHSFGGTIGLRYLDRRADTTAGLILMSSPISYPQALRHILAKCRAVYAQRGDGQGLAYLDSIARMPSDSAEYAGYLFQHAMACNLYSPDDPTDEARALARQLVTSEWGRWASAMNPEPFTGFVTNERYTRLELHDLVRRHAARTYGIYGSEDWALDPDSRRFLETALPSGHLSVLKRASHGVFLDQRAQVVARITAIFESLK